MRLVLDTNVLVSAFIKSGTAQDLFDKIVEGEAELVLSNEILSEFLGVVRRPKFAKYIDQARINLSVSILNKLSIMVKTTSKFHALEDKGDNAILNTALDGDADIIVSGDHHLLDLKQFKGIKIMSVEEAIRVIRKGL